MATRDPHPLQPPALRREGEKALRREAADRLASIRGLVIRPFARTDVAALQAYFEGLSLQSRHDRFMGARRQLSDEEIELLLPAREQTHFALLAQIRDGSGFQIAGEAQYAIDRLSRTAELALSVADTWQHRGVGLALMRALECCAARHEVRMLAGETLRSNDGMRYLARSAGFEIVPLPGDWHHLQFQKVISGPCVAKPLAMTSEIPSNLACGALRM